MRMQTDEFQRGEMRVLNIHPGLGACSRVSPSPGCVEQPHSQTERSKEDNWKNRAGMGKGRKSGG